MVLVSTPIGRRVPPPLALCVVKVFSRDSSNQVELQAQLVDELCLSLYNDTQNSSLTYAESSVLLQAYG